MKDKFLRVMMPYILVGLFLCALQRRPIGQMMYGISHLWFLLCIFECYLLGKLIEPVLQTKHRNKMILTALAIVFVILIPYRIPHVPYLCLYFLIKYFPFYLIGMLACETDFSIFAKNRGKILATILLLLILFAIQQIYPRYFFAVAFGTSIVCLSFAFTRMHNIEKLPAWIVSLDKCSMGIYIVHHILIQEMNHISFFHTAECNHYYVYPVVQFLVITLISWLVVALCQRSKLSKYILG